MSEEEFSDLDDDAKDALQEGKVIVPGSSEIADDEERAAAGVRLGRYVDTDSDDWLTEATRKRVGKEKAKREKLERDRDRERAERERVQQERDDALRRLEQYESSFDDDLKAKVDDLKSRRDKALDEGDLNVYGQLNDEYTDAKIELRDRTRDRRSKPTQKPSQDHDRDNVRDDDRHENNGRGMGRAAQSWVSRNQDWINSPRAIDVAKAAFAASVERELIAGGYSVNDDRTYHELDRRIAEEFGGGASVESFDDDDLDDARGQQQRGSTAGVQRDSLRAGAAIRGGSGRLTTADLQAMAKAGLNPHSPEDRKGWLQRNAEL